MRRVAARAAAMANSISRAEVRQLEQHAVDRHVSEAPVEEDSDPRSRSRMSKHHVFVFRGEEVVKTIPGRAAKNCGVRMCSLPRSSQRR